jgi:hypothetical protein
VELEQHEAGKESCSARPEVDRPYSRVFGQQKSHLKSACLHGGW